MRSTCALLLKELSGIRSLIVLGVVLLFVSFASTAATGFLDETGIGELLEDAPFTAVVLAVLAAITAGGLLVRERESGTLDLLDALPVTRSRVFWVKWCVALAFLWIFLAADSLFYFACDRLSRTSVTPPPDWSVVGIAVGINAVLALCFLNIALLLAFLRRWALLIVGIFAWIIIWLRFQDLPFVELLDPFAAAKPNIHDGRWSVPWRILIPWSVFSALCLLAAHAVFCLRDRWVHRLAHILDHTWWGKSLKWGAALVIPVVWLGSLGTIAVHFDDPEATEREYLESLRATAASTERGALLSRQTNHYTFSYWERDEELVELLGDRADSAYQRVATALGYGGTAGTIAVDLTQPIMQHNAGQAYWNKVRLALPPSSTPDENLAILGHETVHVLLERLSEGRLASAFPSARWFHEGAASYLEYQHFHPPAKLAEMDRWLAAAHALLPLDFEDLVEDDALRRTRHPNVAYPAGRLFVAVLVQVHGERAPAGLASALARHDAPRDLTGLPLWRDTFQACGYDLERVRAAFRARLADLAEENRPWIAELPAPTSVAVVPDGSGGLVVRPTFDRDLPETVDIVCRVRPAEDSTDFEIDSATLDDDGTFRFPATRLTSKSCWYQIGLQPPELPLFPAFGPWKHGQLQPATDTGDATGGD